jgi:hypothetical protein
MPQRNLRIIKQSRYETIAVCEACNKKFTSQLRKADQAEWEIKTRFDEHECSRWNVNRTAPVPDTKPS